MSRYSIAVGGICFLLQSAFAKDAATLKSELATILPQGKKVRVAWSEGTSGSSTLYGVDSDDGVVRELTPTSLFTSSRDITVPFITRDGQKVVFAEENGSKIYVVNWDGTNLRKLFDNTTCVGGTWQHPDSLTQWAIVGSARVKIDNVAQTKNIWSDQMCMVGDNDGWGFSVDGTRVGGFLCGGNSGIAPSPSGSAVCNSCGGCNFAMRPTTGAYEYCHFPSGHATIHIHNANGSLKENPDITSTVESWASSHIAMSGGEPRSLKFSSDPGYVIYWWFDWKVNPILFRLSDKKWVGMRDNLTTTGSRESDAVFINSTGTATPFVGQTQAPVLPGSEGMTAYTLSGRRVSAPRQSLRGPAAVRGIVVRSAAGKTKAMVDLW